MRTASSTSSPSPTPEAMGQLTAALDGDHPEAAAAALGAQARDLAEDAPEAADRAIDQLIARYQAAVTPDEQIAALEALGNSGSPRALPILAGCIAADQPGVAEAALFGLRFLPGPEVDALLDAVITRGDDRVPAAVRAVAYRSPLLWQARLADARARFAEVEAFTRAIDAVLALWA